MGFFTFSIPQEEKTFLIARMHWTGYLGTWLKVLATGLVLGLIFTLSWPFWWQGRWGKIIITVFVFAALAYLLLDFWKKYLTTYIITQCRIIDITQEKIFRRMITEISLDEIEETIIKQNHWWDKALKRGDVIVKLKSKKGVMVFYSIRNPELVQSILGEIEEETAKIVDKKGKECDVILEDNRVKTVPLSYSYYGEEGVKGAATDKEKEKEEGKEQSRSENLIVVKKKKKKSKKLTD